MIINEYAGAKRLGIKVSSPSYIFLGYGIHPMRLAKKQAIKQVKGQVKTQELKQEKKKPNKPKRQKKEEKKQARDLLFREFDNWLANHIEYNGNKKMSNAELCEQIDKVQGLQQFTKQLTTRSLNERCLIDSAYYRLKCFFKKNRLRYIRRRGIRYLHLSFKKPTTTTTTTSTQTITMPKGLGQLQIVYPHSPSLNITVVKVEKEEEDDDDGITNKSNNNNNNNNIVFNTQFKYLQQQINFSTTLPMAIIPTIFSTTKKMKSNSNYNSKIYLLLTIIIIIFFYLLTFTNAGITKVKQQNNTLTIDFLPQIMILFQQQMIDDGMIINIKPFCKSMYGFSPLVCTFPQGVPSCDTLRLYGATGIGGTNLDMRFPFICNVTTTTTTD
ncbi:hypothetical protein DFA_10430 [Cavenderia fasciculata]|uniref:Transmembrane protein n=1 Tax=Cavenderia fasciculata TaxID=261658 RepID=F4QA69_CACFS|nr:uncharacterized protein DFA_10430 [Cavenderia fasciculata]EGG15588.1 hypothetical protein DFA_10430 [Cavenderia fasciculata]|eukprot:XP_004354330.1 hypothetical protein DFA_10430 [Cavenderia fasciculata]